MGRRCSHATQGRDTSKKHLSDYPRKKHETVPDPAWIEKCAQEGWIPVSGDKRLVTNVENKAALIKHKTKLFLLADTNSLPEEWAAAVIVGREDGECDPQE